MSYQEYVEYLKRLMPILSRIIEGYLAVLELNQIFISTQADNQHELIKAIEGRETIKKKIDHYSGMYKFAEKYLDDHNEVFEIELKLTYQQWTEQKEWENKFTRDPYRWRVPAWLREPIQKIFKKQKVAQ